MKTYSVYITTNLLEPHKAYVGMTNGKKKNYLGSGTLLKEDIEKIGKENFERSFLGTFDNIEECHYWEGFYIRTLKTHISVGGYNGNIKGGGYCELPSGELHPAFGIKKSKEQKEQMRLNNLGDKNPMFGKKHSKETKDKIKIKAKDNKTKFKEGHIPWNKGKNISDEQKEKLRVYMTGLKRGPYKKNKK